MSPRLFAVCCKCFLLSILFIFHIKSHFSALNLQQNRSIVDIIAHKPLFVQCFATKNPHVLPCGNVFNVFKEVVFAVKQFVVLGFGLVAIVLPFCLRQVVDLAQNVLFLDGST